MIDEPDAFEAFNYLYSFVGIFTGPYYTYQTFADSVHFGVPSRQDTKALVYEKIRRLYWSLPLLLAFTWLGPVDVSVQFLVSFSEYFVGIITMPGFLVEFCRQ